MALIGALAQNIDLRISEIKTRTQNTFSGLFKPNIGGLVPHNIVRPQNLLQHHRVKRVGHRIDRAAKMRAHRIAVPEMLAQCHLGMAKIVRYLFDRNPRAQKWRPEIIKL